MGSDLETVIVKGLTLQSCLCAALRLWDPGACSRLCSGAFGFWRLLVGVGERAESEVRSVEAMAVIFCRRFDRSCWKNSLALNIQEYECPKQISDGKLFCRAVM